MKKALIAALSAFLVTSGVACAGGPSDEFCDAALDFVALIDDNLGVAPTSEGYGELEAGVAELTAILQRMSDATDDEDVKGHIAVVQESFAEFAETADQSVITTDETREAIDGIEAYASDCEGFQEAADAAGEVDTSEGEEVDEGLEALQSIVKNAAVAEESYLTSNGTYTDSVEDLEAEGLDVPEGITVEVEADEGTAYCIQASDDSGSVFHYDSTEGEPAQGPC